MEQEVSDLWERYKETHTRDLRDRLILHYSPLVKYVAGRVAVGLPQNVEHADLVSYGIFGLIDAIEKFDLSRGFKFESYAISRIKGAILDGLRSIDWVPRSLRAKARAVERAYGKLEGNLHRTPTDAELADAYALGDVFVLPSRGGPKDVEGFGIVFLEAAACGLPSVGTRSGGIEDAVIDGETGLLVDDDLVAALSRLVQDASLRERLGARARERVRAELTWAHTAQGVERGFQIASTDA